VSQDIAYRCFIIIAGLIFGPTFGWSFPIVKGAPMMALESPSKDSVCQAWDLNDDGSLVVGECDDLPVRWVDGSLEILDGPLEVTDSGGSVSQYHPISGRAFGTNANGEIVADIAAGPAFEAAMWDDATQVWKALPKAHYVFSSIRGFSDNGYATGRLFEAAPAFTSVAVLWNHGQIIQLQEMPDYYSCIPYSVNNSGQATGDCLLVGQDNSAAVLWMADGSIDRELGAGITPASTFGRGINSGGDVVGTLDGAAMRWNAPNYRPTTLAGLGVANSINDSGDAAGYLGINGGTGDESPNAVIWRSGSTVPEPLGTLGGDLSWARAISNQGIVAGFASNGADVTKAFIVWPGDSSVASEQVEAALEFVAQLPLDAVRTAGNQVALLQYLEQAARQIEQNSPAIAVDRLQQALLQTDGCALRGAPDTDVSPFKHDTLLNCSDQAVLFPLIILAIDALSG
jgi:uncharacterized membrane protein